MADSKDVEEPDVDVEDQATEGDETPQRMALDVKVESRGACQRHVTVTIPRDDVDRYFDKAFSDMMPTVAVPGFRAGRAPRKLVEARFRKEVTEQVKGSLLVDSMTQATEEQNLAAISEPDIDPVSVVVPDEGPMTFEFDLEVRPDFDLPEWKGLKIERPVKEFTDADVDTHLKNVLTQHGRLVVKNGPAAPGDYLSTKLSFKHGDEVISSSDEEVIRIRPVLSFRDGKIEKFDKLMTGVKAGQTKEAKAKLSVDAPNEALRGKEVTAVFEVLEVKQVELPELTPALLEDLGDFESEEALRQAIREQLDRRLTYHQQQQARQQVLGALTVAADWELPPELLARQSQRELQRSILELRRSGFSDAEIRAHENELRQNSRANTARALKEHFILERIAEAEKIEVTPEDYDDEVELIASQSNESPRRVRAQLEKRGLMDSLHNQIIERKTVDLILSHAKFKDVPFELEGTQAEAIDQSAGGEERADIPEAKYSDTAQPLRMQEERE